MCRPTVSGKSAVKSYAGKVPHPKRPKFMIWSVVSKVWTRRPDEVCHNHKRVIKKVMRSRESETVNQLSISNREDSYLHLVSAPVNYLPVNMARPKEP